LIVDHSLRKETPEVRFWAKVEKREDGCWLWTRNCTSGGYGQFTNGGKKHLAHRVAYEWLVGPIPPGLDLDHLCRVRNCVNPGHLEPVTRRENVRRGEAGENRKDMTHCLRGHLFVIRDDGSRRCRQCQKRRRETYKNRR
jgi:hypothetical protein